MPTEAQNTLRSRAKLKVIDLLGQGRIEGLARGMGSIYLNGTPLVNENGSTNFPGFDFSRDVQFLPGTASQGYISGFSSIENEVSVGVKVTKDSPEGAGSGDGSVTRTITDPDTDAARVTVRIPALAVTNTTTGDITGGTIAFKIDVRANGGAWVPTYASKEWRTLANPASTTPAGVTGLKVAANVATTPQAHTIGFYTRKDGGAWVLQQQKFIPAQSSASGYRGWYGYGTPTRYDFSVSNLPAGSYQAQVTINQIYQPLISLEYFAEHHIAIEGKTTSPYDASYRVPLPVGGAPWDIRLTRITADNTVSNIQDDLYWFSYTEIIDNKLSMPNMALMGLVLNAEDFGGQVPKREYDVFGRNTIKVPSNYDSHARTYTGIWDGTFKEAWTDNPAWIFYDLLTNKRYGLGDNIDADQIDKYGLYVIGQYCDELVEAPAGYEEPRYTINTVINSQQEAYNLLASIASAFRGMIYWSGGSIHAVADMPTDPTVFIGPANVIDGVFTYQGASMKARHTVARVSWNNPDDGHKLNVEIYEDVEAIRRYGYRVIDVNAIGCTSRGLARRWGKWIVSSDLDNADTVSYRASFDHFNVRPGDVVSISDPDYSGVEMSGRLVSVTDNENGTHTLEFDRNITLTAAEASTLYVALPSGDVAEIDVTSGSTVTDSTIIIDDTDLPEIPVVGEFWQLKIASVEPRLWRVFSVVESEKNIYQVSAMYYDPNKFDKVESDLNFAEADFTAYPTGELAAPTGVSHSEYLRKTGAAITSNVVLSWTRPADPRAEFFEVQYQLDGFAWQAAEPNLTRETSIDIRNTQVATYNFRVRTQDAAGIFRSPWAVYSSVALLGKEKPPEDVANFTATVEKYGVLLNWNPVSDIDINYYEIRMGGTGWDDADFVGRTAGTTYKYEDQTTATLTFRIKARDTNDNWSINATSENSTGETQNVPTVTTTSIPIGIQVDIAGDLKRGFSHWELRRRVYSTQVVTAINERITTRIYFDEAYDDLVFGEAYEYSARAVDTNGVASTWSAYSSPVFPLQIQSNDITADQIVAKDFRTAQDVGVTVDGVKFTADGIEMWEEGVRKVFIPTSGDPEFAGLLTAAAGYIGGWQIFPTYLQSSNIKLDSAGLLQTLDFVSGNKGWKINQDGSAEFNNIRARGAVKTVVFEKDEISVVGGRTLIRPAGVVKDYDYTDFINAAGGAYLEDCWDKLNELLGTNYTYAAPVFADYAEYYAAEMAYYDELCVAMGFNQFTCAILEADYDDATKDAYLTACWSQLMTLLDLTTTTPAIPSLTFAAFKALENGYFDEVAEAIDNPPVFEPFISDADTAIETDNADQFAIGDIVRIKDGLASDYWGRVSAISGDIVSIAGEYGEPFGITAGQTVVNYGITGSGGILLDGQGPMMDVYTHDGAPWNGTDLRLRIGNLNGWGTINDNIYGIAIGNPTGEYLVYDSTSGRLRLNGAIQISEGTGIANFSDAGALAGLDDIDLSYVTDAGTLASANNLDDVGDGTTYKKTTANEKTGAARAYSGLDANNMLVTAVIPASAVSPAGAGLFLGSNYLGFYSGGWKTYMDNLGNFALVGGGAHGLSWNAETGVLTIAGSISILGGSGYGNLTDKPTSLAGINITEGSKLTGIEAGADVTSTHTAADTTKVAGTAAATVRDNAANALANAATAQSTANAAVSSAATANGLLADIAADDKFTPDEKQAAKKEWDIIVSEKTKNDAQADAFAVSKVAYGAAYTALSGYITPLLASLTTTDNITGTTFRSTFKAYYDARTDILNAIAAKAKALADAAQGDATDALANAATAQSTANAAVSSAATANGLLADIAADNKLTPAEKKATKKEWDIIVSEKTKNDAQADAFAVSKVAYGAAYTALSSYITPLLASLTTTDNITGTTFRSTFKAYYDARTDILNAIAAKAKALADAAQGDATDALANAATAQGTADSAVTAAATANGLLANIAADNKFTPVEKQSARKEWDVIAAEQPINSLHAMNIVGFSAGIAAGSFNEAASDAYWSECWTKLNTLLGEANTEPAFAAQTYAAFVAEESSYYTLVKQVIDSEIITVPPSPDILALNGAYVAAFQALATYLNNGTTWSSGVPSWISDANLSATDTIVGATFRGTWKAYYDARTALLNAIAAKSKIIADLAQDAAGSVALRVDTTLDINNLVTTAVIPKSAVAPTSAGLFLGANYLGYHNGDDWKTYMDANGNFALAGTTGNHGLTWNAATNVLTVAGTVNANSGNIAGFILAATDFTAGSSTNAIGISTDTSKKAFWAGNATPASAKFYVGHDGSARIGAFVSQYAAGWGDWSFKTTGAVDSISSSVEMYNSSSNGYTGIELLHTDGTYSSTIRVGSGGILFQNNSTVVISGFLTREGLTNASAPSSVTVANSTNYGYNTSGRVYAGGGFFPMSDERVKSDIESVSVLKPLKTLRVKKYRLDDAKIKRLAREKEIENNLKIGNKATFDTALADEPDLPDYNQNLSIGVMAADFNAAFGIGRGNNETYNLTDGIGVALRAIQELAEIVDDQAAEIAELRAALKLPKKQKKQADAIEFTAEEIEKAANKHVKAAYESIMREAGELNN